MNENTQIAEGEKIIENNDFLKDLCGLMENEQFNNFFNKHMSDWLDIKCSVTYMKLYNEFKTKYKKLNNKELDKNIIVYLLTKIMKDKKLRPWSIKTVDNMLNNRKIKFFDEFETFLLANNDVKLLAD